jgi:dTDP-4-dehydrorhamnose reductase
MLGQAVSRAFSDFEGEVILSSRSGAIPNSSPDFAQIRFDARADSTSQALSRLDRGDYVINCIGVIKSEIDEQSTESLANATAVNSAFPKALAQQAELKGIRVIQIATDCAFSGKSGHYSESSTHDAQDHYGKTKSDGEVVSNSMMHLRVSIIGPEIRGHKSLYDWVALQPLGAKITGFRNHRWNGIPAKHFAKISRAVIESGLFKSGTQHIVPRDEVTKSELVRLIAQHARRSDLVIEDGLAPDSIDRTLLTENPTFNVQLWAAAGYSIVPSIAELVAEI